jgi:hypothetical protein
MIHDATVPEGIEPAVSTVERAGVCYTAARWTPSDLETLADRLQAHGRESLVDVSDTELLTAWCDTVELYRNPQSAERQALDPALLRLCKLSPAGLEAGLEAVLGGVGRLPAENLRIEVDSWKAANEQSPFVVIALASNLPALAVQTLLPALLLRCPAILKSPTSEPLFAPAFVTSLVERMPALAPAFAAITWRGGDIALERPLLDAADRILAYGEADTLSNLQQRAGDKVFAYGPKASLAVIGADVDPTRFAAGLARDIALFDQRGCLSIQAIFTEGDTALLAREVGAELKTLATRWPAGSVDPVAAAGVQQIRSEAALRGLNVVDLPLAAGTVVIEPEERFRPTPGLRTVRIHPLSCLDSLPEILVEWSDHLQGAALAGDSAWALQPRLQELGFSHFAVPGQLQSPDASWHNGGVHPFTALTGRAV